MPYLVEGKWPGEFIASEDNGYRSRGIITVTGGAPVIGSTVLGQQTMGAATGVAGANTGLDTISAIVTSHGVKLGVYSLICTVAGAAGKFAVWDPTGELVGIATVGVAFSEGGLAFTIADNATHAVIDDTFTITVAPGSGKFVPLAATAADGSDVAAGILYANVDATSADVTDAVAILRAAEVNSSKLNWGSLGSTPIANAIIALAKLGIIVRNSA